LLEACAGEAVASSEACIPGDLPIEQATEIAFKINLRTARALGLDIPLTPPASADEAIE
jgi:putative ABC transport system substrate-binding protein